MSKEKVSTANSAPASAPAGILRHDPSVALRQKQAPRPPAEGNSEYPLILIVEKREPVWVALKTVLETTGCDLMVVARASEALSLAATYSKDIHFLVIPAVMAELNAGLLAHLFRR